MMVKIVISELTTVYLLETDLVPSLVLSLTLTSLLVETELSIPVKIALIVKSISDLLVSECVVIMYSTMVNNVTMVLKMVLMDSALLNVK